MTFRSLHKVLLLLCLLTLAGCASGTATAPSPSPTLSGNAQATATALTAHCFIDPSAPTIPNIYDGTATPGAGQAQSPALSGKPVTLAQGLKYVDVKTGSGPAATNGSNVTVEYTGWLASNCTKFDSSYDHGQPFTFPLGQGQVIAGWDQGVVGMKAGGVRRIYIPSALGYGNQAQGPIPANADLIFDVTMLTVK